MTSVLTTIRNTESNDLRIFFDKKLKKFQKESFFIRKYVIYYNLVM